MNILMARGKEFYTVKNVKLVMDLVSVSLLMTYVFSKGSVGNAEAIAAGKTTQSVRFMQWFGGIHYLG